MVEFCAKEFGLSGSIRVLAVRLGAVVAEPVASDAAADPRWWVTPAEAAEVLAAELAADVQAAPAPGAQSFKRINLARGGEC